jgi:hypothetical protein
MKVCNNCDIGPCYDKSKFATKPSCYLVGPNIPKTKFIKISPTWKTEIKATVGYDWEDPECDLIASIRQLQELFDEQLRKTL